MNRNRFTRLTLAVLAVAALALGAAAAPSNAVVADSDDVRTYGPNGAFGTGSLSATGMPSGFARVDFDVAGGLTTPSMVGTIYAAPGICVRPRLESYDLLHVFINGRNGSQRCGTAGGANQWSVNLSNTGDADTTHVHVIVQTFDPASGTWSNYRTTTTDLGD